MDRPSGARRSRWRRRTLGVCLAILCGGGATVADARKFFEPSRARAGDRVISYRITEVSSTVVLRWENLCYDRDVVCSSGEATYRDDIKRYSGYPARGLTLIRRKPSFRTGRGHIVYPREATERITKRDIDHADCTESGTLRPSGLQETMTYSLVLAKQRVRIELESRLGLNSGCTYVGGGPPGDATLRSAAVNVGPTFDLPLSRLRGKHVTLDLRDPDRPYAIQRSKGTVSSRLRLKMTRVDR